MAQFFSVHPTHPQPRLIRQAAAILRAGGVIAYPTDSSYALGCQLGDLAAAKRIRQIRGVDDAHHLTLVCRDLADAGRFTRLSNWQFRIVRQGVPGAYTFLLPGTREVPRRLLHPKRSTIGFRVPDHPVVSALLGELGEPILSSTLIVAGRRRAAQRPGSHPRAPGNEDRWRDRRRALRGGTDDDRRSRGRARRDRPPGKGRRGAARDRREPARGGT